ncbi:MAG: MarR family winged helix-turn-helix transcriptional regulator [Lacisediminihabitans sp.]
MSAREIASFTGFLIRRTQQVHASLWLRVTSGEITSVQFGALNLLDRYPGIDQRTLGEHLELDRSTIADISVRLQRRGLIERERDPADRRRNILNLTASGRSILRSLEPKAQEVNRQLVSGLSARDRTELHRLLELLLASPITRDLAQ